MNDVERVEFVKGRLKNLKDGFRNVYRFRKPKILG